MLSEADWRSRGPGRGDLSRSQWRARSRGRSCADSIRRAQRQSGGACGARGGHPGGEAQLTSWAR